ncbi:hypothetical protein SZ54_4760 [Rhizobium sp. UR51a]|nr:hypothetical protein SZ54_4760 [Rhizobium sp. UR51a]
MRKYDALALATKLASMPKATTLTNEPFEPGCALRRDSNRTTLDIKLSPYP